MEILRLCWLVWVCALAGLVLGQDARGEGPPAPAGVRPAAEGRGFATKAAQMERVVPYCEKMAAEHSPDPGDGKGGRPGTRWVASICPHDDYVYAGPVYGDALRNLKAKTVILFGVCHQAKKWGLKDQLVFDDFTSWQEPFGPVKVSPLRDEIMKALPKGDFVVHDEAQVSEWSVEGIVPWLQYADRDVQIVSILVPYMDWGRTDVLAKDLADVLAGIVKARHLELGKDLAFVMSSDGVHYGDQWADGWSYAPFGVGADGYLKATGQDQCLVQWYLDGRLERGRIERLAETLVDQKDVTRYKVTWCGRFSITLGLDTLSYLTEKLALPALEGVQAGYGTSIGTGFLPFEEVGLSATAHENLHHWVSYIAEGYR